MSDKKRTSISLDKDVYRFLKQADINQSGLINELVKEYRESENQQTAALQIQYEQKMEDGRQLQEQAERKFKQAEEIKELIEEHETQRSEELEQAVEVLSDKPPSVLVEDSQPVQYWSSEVDMEPSELINYIRSNT